MKIGKYTLPEIKKAIIALIGAVVSILITVPDVFAEWTSEGVVKGTMSAVALLTAVLVFEVRNRDKIDPLLEGKLPPPSSTSS